MRKRCQFEWLALFIYTMAIKQRLELMRQEVERLRQEKERIRMPASAALQEMCR